MSEFTKGIYKYKDNIDDAKFNKLPNQLYLDKASTEGALIRLLCGKVDIIYNVEDREKVIKQPLDYTVLPAKNNNKLTYQVFSKAIGYDILDVDVCEKFNRYLTINRKNKFVHEQLLNEMSSAFIYQSISPIESFVHIYRTLEFMSYTFPMIYASCSQNYKGSFENLKKFMSGDSDGELKFFKIFLNELFKDKDMILSYSFDVAIDSANIDAIKKELSRVISKNYYEIDNKTFSIKFLNVADLMITLRNRYFHMLIGKGTENFYDITYDKRELFQSFNPMFINWITVIFQQIVHYSFASSLS